MKLSVAMITYNQERYIGQAIESVLAQRVNFDYEIVIGENCSTDGKREIVMDYQRRYPERIVLILRAAEPSALCGTSSRVLTACRGQYLTILEGDDYWTSVDKLEKQVDFLDAHPDCGLCCHRVQNFRMRLAPQSSDVFPPRAAGPYTIRGSIEVEIS